MRTPFSIERLSKYFKGSHKLPKHFFNYIIANMIIAWAFITFQKIESILQFIHWKWLGFHNKFWFVYKYSNEVEAFGILFAMFFPTFVKKKLDLCAIFHCSNKSALLTVIFRGRFNDFNVAFPISSFIIAHVFLNLFRKEVLTVNNINGINFTEVILLFYYCLIFKIYYTLIMASGRWSWKLSSLY